jgi:hypothetical protein
MSGSNYLAVLFLVFLDGIILSAAFFTWKKIWFSPHGAEVPLDSSGHQQEMKKQKVYGKTFSISIFRSMMWSLIKKLDMEYWATHCGNDGYLYLLF